MIFNLQAYNSIFFRVNEIYYKKQDQRCAIITNGLEIYQFKGQLNELSVDEHEEQKRESIPIEGETSEIEINWIQIKEETEELTLD